MSHTRPKSGTEIALASKREAYTERLCKPNPVLSDMWERDAEAVLTLPFPPEVGGGGEVVSRSPLPPDHAGDIISKPTDRSFELRNTLAQGATRTAEDASIRRADLLMQPSFNVAAMALDAADSIDARNSIEKMLSHQMALAHEAVMRMMDRALSYQHSKPGDQIEACRCINASARMMSAFNDGALTIQRLRNGGNQTVTVQHVTVAQGGQAVIGNVQTRGAARRGRKSKNG